MIVLKNQFSNPLILDLILTYLCPVPIVPFIRIPTVFQTGGSKVQQQAKLVIAHMQIIDYLCFKFSDYFRHGFQLYSYFIFNKKIIEKVMFKFYSMKDEINMLFPLIFDTLFFQ